MTRYITTTLPYVNADPHLGHALEFVQADVYVRTMKLKGESVFFNTGTDEHGTKIFEKAQEKGVTPTQYTDEYAARFRAFADRFLISYTTFTRTTSPAHAVAAQTFWKRCASAGDIYKATYEVRYCVGCELEKTDSELEDGRCPLHPNKELEIIAEENYYFRFSKYQEQLLALYSARPDFVVPKERLHEIKSFVEGGLKDFSISRRKDKLPWGVPVPGDDEHVMYVWFDALVNYISAIGWPREEGNFAGCWPGTQFAGKDNLRQQTAMWQAMLMSAGLLPSKQVFIHGFINSGGQKMSKSLGNVIDPTALADTYGVEAVRYMLLRHVHPAEDTDITPERLEEWYTANLVHGLGNLVARVMKLAETHLDVPIERPVPLVMDEFFALVEQFQFNLAVESIWKRIQHADERITKEEPFKVIKENPEKGKEIIRELVVEVYNIAQMLNPIMPETAEIIKKAAIENKKPENLFPRLDK